MRVPKHVGDCDAGVQACEAKAEAARLGVTVTRYIEEALRERIAKSQPDDLARGPQIEERNRLMELLLQRTAHFRAGPQPNRDEMHER